MFDNVQKMHVFYCLTMDHPITLASLSMRRRSSLLPGWLQFSGSNPRGLVPSLEEAGPARSPARDLILRHALSRRLVQGGHQRPNDHQDQQPPARTRPRGTALCSSLFVSLFSDGRCLVMILCNAWRCSSGWITVTTVTLFLSLFLSITLYFSSPIINTLFMPVFDCFRITV